MPRHKIQFPTLLPTPLPTVASTSFPPDRRRTPNYPHRSSRMHAGIAVSRDNTSAPGAWVAERTRHGGFTFSPLERHRLELHSTVAFIPPLASQTCLSTQRYRFSSTAEHGQPRSPCSGMESCAAVVVVETLRRRGPTITWMFPLSDRPQRYILP
ncbi:uncharacterized protein B0T23DRAFT_2470 [Neurospora hispaniola]|uniref:Uncharacterized protein n=1 Tax=Neurospora hispaniola TaxID=588809 RepID=A0AAJ0IEN0_9PEZI|nr:hypothetical protein B0T23DRAFT_2470 [Neurospora hispaniola]